MKKLAIIGFGLVALLFSSCSTYHYTTRQTDILRQDFKTMPTVVDVKADYAKRVEVVSNWHHTKADAMNECRYLAIMSKKIDVVVDPVFKIQCRPWKIRRRYQATLTGYAGYYENQRTVYEDMEQLKKFTREDIEKYLIFYNPAVLQYMTNNSDVINIYHESGQQVKPAKPAQEEPASPAPKRDDKNKNKRK